MYTDAASQFTAESDSVCSLPCDVPYARLKDQLVLGASEIILTTCGRWLWDSSGACRRSGWLSPSPSSSLNVCDDMSVHSAAMHELASLKSTGASWKCCVYGAFARHASAVNGHDFKLRVVYTTPGPGRLLCVREREREIAVGRIDDAIASNAGF